MNMNQKQELSLFAEELYRYIYPATLNQLAIEAGGMKRKRKCQRHHFLSLCAWLNQQVATAALTQLCSHKAGVKIHLEYDLLSGGFSDVKIEPEKRSDQAYVATRTDMIQKNELYIRDLGYFRLQDFKSIQDKQGYYLSRLKLPTKIYRKEFETVIFKTKPPQLKPVYIQIHLEDITKQLQPGQVYELHDAYVGTKDKLPTRIVVYRCTEEQKQKRLRDRAIREKKKGLHIKSARSFYKVSRYI